ncbi:unnamed protein product, partial [Mesorhabditis belari]|uniref:Uncharacterized protein n=1 Tax=Mesorhabditis belari TaxID=2138241 RepID=A0AAF3ELR5_9BILA
MNKLRRRGKTSRGESLLMLQMIMNSFLNLTNTIFWYFFAIILNLFFGNNVMFVYNYAVDFNQAMLFNLVASIICILCFRKPKETRPQNGVKVNVTASSIAERLNG